VERGDGMDAVRESAPSGDTICGGASYEAPRLRVLGSLRELTREDVPAYSGRELGPSSISD
jgi:hypothetical protein